MLIYSICSNFILYSFTNLHILKFYYIMHNAAKFFVFLSMVSCSLLLSCNSAKRESVRKTINLAGEWQLCLDTADKGLALFCKQLGFTDSLKLPGTLDENEKGSLNQANELNHLHRKFIFTGAAWFRKQIDIPTDWKGEFIQLLLERAKVTQVWLDTNYLGSSALLSVSQVYNIGDFATPGKHWLTIRVNNDPALVPIGGSHAYSDDTQTNWNGIIGKLELQATSKIHILSVKTVPDVTTKNFHLSVVVGNPSKTQIDGTIKVSAELWNSEISQKIPVKNYKIILKPESDAHMTVTMPFGNNPREWSEFSPEIYRFSFSLYDSENKLIDEYLINTGFREFKTSSTNFTINGKKTFLRGKHDGCVFPLTGHPPMDTASWTKLFRIAQSYGINHYRFHSWCPPEAAFLAADATGMYLQPELPNWKSFEENESPEHLAFQRNEGLHIIEEYGNHPSFVMLSLGNELGGSRKIMKSLIDEFRTADQQILYAQGSNNFFWDPSIAEGDDYWTTMLTGKQNDSLTSNTRGSFSFADSKSGGWINTMYPSSNSTYSRAIYKSPVPVIGHEVGQYLVFPDFAEIQKYSGILEARNLAGFKKKLNEKGMLSQALDFHKASGAISALCYREEIEKALRTPGFGGFQLLDLQDYPGQGTALVGLLDAFMESKGIISSHDFRNFCSPVVLLAKMEKYCWTSSEVFKANLELANFSNKDFSKNTIKWLIQDAGGLKIAEGEFNLNSKHGSLSEIGNISLSLEKIKTSQKLQLLLSIEGTSIQNNYNIWIYPDIAEIKVPDDLKITSQIDSKTIQQLQAGAKVLFIPDQKKIINKSVGGLFISDFWNYGMFKSIAEGQKKEPSPGTMGILVDPTKSFFKNFPTEAHSDWQWWIIAKNSRPFILDGSPQGYLPIVQIIDNFERDFKLGILFEFSIGKGNLLISTTNIDAILNKPEGRQYYQSILNYASSDSFKPSTRISASDLLGMFK